MPFSKEHADFALNFFENVLRHTQDEWSGKPFILAPWEEEAIAQIFGNLKDDGTRQIELAYLEVPKKSGKTELAAGIVLLALFLDTNLGCQVYGAAAAQRQALNVYRAASTMVTLSPHLSKVFRILHSTHRIVKKKDVNSFYAAIAADGDLTDGVNPAVTVADEVHRWKTRKMLENFDVLAEGGITRKQTLTAAITTAGVRDESPLAWRLHEKTLRINQGLIKDPTFYGRIYAADPEDDPSKPATWKKANPSLIDNGGFLPISKIEDKYQSCLSDPEKLRAFRRYFLNQWDQKENRAIDLQRWDSIERPWTAQPLADRPPEDVVRPLAPEIHARFVEESCYVGIDMSLTTDFTSVAFVFPDKDGFFDVLPFFWLPENGLKKRELRDGMPYRTWVEQGWLETCEGSAIDHRDIKARLMWGSRNFDVKQFCFDRYNTREISLPMIDEGHECVEIEQGYSGQNDAVKKVLELVAQGKLRHGGHPILRWNASCVSTKSSNDQIKWVKPERQKDTSRIDGISALTDAMARAMLAVPESPLTVDAW